MRIEGYKTKIGAGVIALSGGIAHLSIEWALTAAALGAACAFYGLYDRQNKNSRRNKQVIEAQSGMIEELKKRIKKPMLRG